MKIKSILASILAITLLASCESENSGGKGNGLGDFETAYVSLQVTTPMAPGSRATGSTEVTGEAYEDAITSLYAVLFDDNDLVVNHPKEPVLQELTGTMTAPDPIRVVSDVKKILLVANPGPDMLIALKKAQRGLAFDQLNAAVQLAFTKNSASKPEILVNELRTLAGDKNTNATYSKFTMINSDKLTSIQKVFVVGSGTGEYPTEDAAKAAAQADASKQKIQIERMASKLTVDKGTNVSIPTGSKFELKSDYWTLDVLNSTFFPYAEKTDLTGAHTPPTGGAYTAAFYTEDPNFALAAGHVGLQYNNLIRATMEPNVTWLGDKKTDYCIENTMEANDQLYKNATRVILRATYYPDASWTGDWYMYGTKVYQTLVELVADYDKYKNADPQADPANYAFKVACEDMLLRATEASKTSGGTQISVTTFSNLTQAILDAATIKNAGELIKDENGCVRWYQNGLNYYYYEIRHDNTNDVPMAYGKYGVVRNNSYYLTLNKVKGPGTPWYPSVNPDPDPLHPEFPDPVPDPDPEPEPTDPIDQTTGFISFEVKVAPWIYWESGMDI